MRTPIFFWVAGPSSVGKRTFIDRVIADRLNWATKLRLGPVQSAGLISGTRPVEEISKARESCECVLIHWQGGRDEKVADLMILQPDAMHVVVRITRELEEYRRVFQIEYPNSRFDDHYQKDMDRVERNRNVVGLFVDVFNSKGAFQVSPWAPGQSSKRHSHPHDQSTVNRSIGHRRLGKISARQFGSI